MYHLDLFSGIGGFALACDWAGIETIGFVEIDKYCQKILRKHWPNVPIVEDIRDVEKIKEIVANATGKQLCRGGEDCPGQQTGLPGARVKARDSIADPYTTGQSHWNGEHRWEQAQGREGEHSPGRHSPRPDGAGLPDNGEPPAILITAGFPCQPFSVAGKRGGDTDDRYLWPETLAVIEAVKPAWVLLENVAGITGILESASASELAPKALKAIYDRDLRFENEYTKHHKISALFENIQERILYKVIGDLEKAGYEVPRTREGKPIVLCVPACAVNAPHRRDRVWIVAHYEGELDRRHQRESGKRQIQQSGIGIKQTDVADATGQGQRHRNYENEEIFRHGTEEREARSTICACETGGNWAVEPELGRVATRLSTKLDGGRLDDQVGDTQAITENLQFAWEVLREMWDNQEFTETPSKLRQQPIPGVMYDLPYRGRPTLWHSPKETNQELYSLWGRVCTSSFQEAQHLLPSLLEQIGEAQRDEAVASIYDSEPAIPRVATGVKNRVDRLKCLGNAIVPQVAYEIIRVIKELEQA